MRRREGETREMKKDQQERRVGGKEETDTLVTAGREIKFRVLCLQLLSSISHNTH